MKTFEGAITALITPFKENCEIDYESLNNLLKYEIENNIDGIVVCGTTGEASTLTDEEHLDVIKYCVEKVSGNIPVIAGTGSNNTLHAIEMSKEAQKLGADGILAVTPYYNKTNQRGLISYYSDIAKSINIPIIMYNVPSRTGVNILPETALAIASKNENIIGIKEASGNISQVSKLMTLSREKQIPIKMYSGNDDQILPLLSLGGNGVISVVSNIKPNLVHNLCSKYTDLNEKIKLQDEVTKISEVLFSDVNPIPVKEACYQLGLIETNKVRSPLIEMDNEGKKRLVKVIKNI